MAQIISGKEVAQKVRERIKSEVEALVEKTGKRPGLAVIIVGEDPASQVYVKNKCKACEEIGYRSVKHMLPTTTTEQDLLLLISELNANPDIHGILVQMPLPSHINEKVIMRAIKPSKDVDAFHPENVGRIVANDYLFAPCTPAGIMTLLEYYGIDVAGKECIIVGRSDIVGKPLALLMTHANGTVTVCHSRTADLAKVCSRADILVVAIGRAKFITADYVKPGAIVIDVGINRTAEGKLCGDVDFESVAPVAAYITPVPGGVGPMTIAMLMKNTYAAATL